MRTDWRTLTREAGYKISHGAIRVQFADGREQFLYPQPSEDGESVRLWSMVAKRRYVAAAQEGSGFKSPHLVAWTRNIESELVGFKVDRRGRLIGEAWVPTAGLDAEGWGIWIQAVAAGCDRLEYLLSGKDRH